MQLAILDIAAPYRASDPVAEALKAAVEDCEYATLDCIEGEFAADLRTALTSRGFEIVERRDR